MPRIELHLHHLAPANLTEIKTLSTALLSFEHLILAEWLLRIPRKSAPVDLPHCLSIFQNAWGTAIRRREIDDFQAWRGLKPQGKLRRSAIRTWDCSANSDIGKRDWDVELVVALIKPAELQDLNRGQEGQYEVIDTRFGDLLREVEALASDANSGRGNALSWQVRENACRLGQI